MNQFMARYDLLLTPTMPMTAFAVNENGAWGGDGVDIGWTPFTLTFNLTRQPAATIPYGLHREGQPIGAHVTLRGDRAWEFLDRLLSLALPRIRDFRGLSDKQFDGHGNYTFGVSEQSIFHEINQDQIDRVRGFDITVVTTARTDDEGRALLREFGFPFKQADAPA